MENQNIKTVLVELFCETLKLESDTIESKRSVYRNPGELEELRGQGKAYNAVRKVIVDFMEKYCPD